MQIYSHDKDQKAPPCWNKNKDKANKRITLNLQLQNSEKLVYHALKKEAFK